MGDDVLSHKINIDIPDRTTILEFVSILKRHYLPSVNGNDVVWEIRAAGKEIAVYFTKKDIVTNSSKLIKDIIENIEDNRIFLLYYIYRAP